MIEAKILRCQTDQRHLGRDHQDDGQREGPEVAGQQVEPVPKAALFHPTLLLLDRDQCEGRHGRQTLGQTQRKGHLDSQHQRYQKRLIERPGKKVEPMPKGLRSPYHPPHRSILLIV